MEKMEKVHSAFDGCFYTRITKTKAKKLIESGTTIYLIVKGETLASPYTEPFHFKPEWLAIRSFDRFVKEFQARNGWKPIVYLEREV